MIDTTNELVRDINESVTGQTSHAKTVNELVREIRDAVDGVVNEDQIREIVAGIIGSAPEALDTLGEIADALSEIYTKAEVDTLLSGVDTAVKRAEATVSSLQTQFDQAMTALTEDSEVQNARVGSDNVQYSTLKARLDAENTELKKHFEESSAYLGFDATNAITSIASGYYTNDGAFSNNGNYSHTNDIDVVGVKSVYISGTLHTYTLQQFPAIGVFLGANDQLIATLYSLVQPNQAPWLVRVPDGATKLIINTEYRKNDYPTSLPDGVLCLKVQKEIVYYNDLSAGKRIKILAGVIRNTGTGWAFIDDANHNPLNMSAVSVDDSGHIVLDYGFTAKKVLSLVGAPDETFASKYRIGGSVGLSQTLFNVSTLHKTIGGMVSYNGSSWNINYTSFSGASFDTATGALTLTHESVAEYPTREKFNVSATGRRCNVQLGEMSDTSLILYFLNPDGTVKKTPDTNMRAYITRDLNSITINADSIISASGNFWLFGVMEV